MGNYTNQLEVDSNRILILRDIFLKTLIVPDYFEKGKIITEEMAASNGHIKILLRIIMRQEKVEADDKCHYIFSKYEKKNNRIFFLIITESFEDMFQDIGMRMTSKS